MVTGVQGTVGNQVTMLQPTQQQQQQPTQQQQHDLGKIRNPLTKRGNARSASGGAVTSSGAGTSQTDAAAAAAASADAKKNNAKHQNVTSKPFCLSHCRGCAVLCSPLHRLHCNWLPPEVASRKLYKFPIDHLAMRIVLVES